MPKISLDAEIRGEKPKGNHWVMLTGDTGREGIAIPERCYIYWVANDFGGGVPIPLYIHELHPKRGITLRCSCLHKQCSLQWRNGKWSGRCITKGQLYDKPS